MSEITTLIEGLSISDNGLPWVEFSLYPEATYNVLTEYKGIPANLYGTGIEPDSITPPSSTRRRQGIIIN